MAQLLVPTCHRGLPVQADFLLGSMAYMKFGFGPGLALRTSRRAANMSDAHRDMGSVIEG
jgi:hypothetical protein